MQEREKRKITNKNIKGTGETISGLSFSLSRHITAARAYPNDGGKLENELYSARGHKTKKGKTKRQKERTIWDEGNNQDVKRRHEQGAVNCCVVVKKWSTLFPSVSGWSAIVASESVRHCNANLSYLVRISVSIFRLPIPTCVVLFCCFKSFLTWCFCAQFFVVFSLYPIHFCHTFATSSLPKKTTRRKRARQSKCRHHFSKALAHFKAAFSNHIDICRGVDLRKQPPFLCMQSVKMNVTSTGPCRVWSGLYRTCCSSAHLWEGDGDGIAATVVVYMLFKAL